ncbi:MAG TPA: M36 family metallopeptidase [Gaiellaceae bacterium]|nr:M36 family metallopeptidase [Gaiellaceae bacterium]
MRLRPRQAVACLAALAALLVPATAGSVVQIADETADRADFDVRTGKLKPTQAQRAAAARLGAAVTWNRFGTPASLSKRGKYLATGIGGKNAVAAARAWLTANRAVLGLTSTAGLVLDSDTRMSASRGHAVNFRQVFDGLEAAEGGLVTVGITGTAASRWKVAYVSSSLSRSPALAAGRIALTPAQAWARAAQAAGQDASAADVRSTKRIGEWQTLRVEDADTLQRVRLVGFPTPRSGVAPAYESLVVDKTASLGDRVFVDARNGRVLARFNLVHNLAEGQELAPQTIPFSGTLPTTPNGCAPRNGPFAVGSGVRFLRIFANADNPGQDIRLRLYRDATLIAEADTGFTPEVIHYEPSGGVPSGDYFAEVCLFGAPVEPRTFTGTFTIDDTAAPHPYLARWQAFPANPPLATLTQFPWGNPNTDTRELWCWTEGEADDCDRVVGNLASRGPWDFNFKANAPTLTTIGNNANAATSWAHPFVPSPPQFRPTSPTRDYLFPWTNDWFTGGCEPTPGAPGATWDDSAAAVNLFAMHNRMHDWSYFLGFTERNWNAQDFNFGLTETFRENDPLIGNVQAGVLAGARDNANMFTLPEGVSSITNMYMWQSVAGAFYAPCVDGDYDMGVIGHEYGHMIENRMIGKGASRTGHHAGAMGESVGDLMSMEYLNENGFVPTDDENRYAVGTYATGNKIRAIRNYGMNFPMSGGVPEPSKQLMINALNFSDMGYDLTGPQVHADGEIWSKTNFAIRQALAAKYDRDYPADDAELQAECANGEVPPQRCPGNRRWMQLVFDAYLLMPTGPSMLQARDAQLAADLMRFGGANQKELWLEFARHGFGRNATSSNTTANTDTDPTPDFEPIGTSPATVTFQARTLQGNTTVAARIFVGHYEGRASPIADTNAATSGTNLDAVARFAPGTYEFVANAPGYGHVRFRERLRAGQSVTLRIRFADNLASANAGAAATGDTSGADATAQALQLRNLVDDAEGTTWTTAGNVDGAGNLSVDGKRVTVDLAGDDAEKIRFVQVSALLSNNANRFTALRQFELWACNADAGADCASDAGFSLVYTSPADAFPGDPPRPVAPHMLLRSFDIPDTQATHLRLVVKTNQCTGGPAFQGDQDADPAVNADCDSNVAANSSRNFVRAAELQAFAASSRVD